MAAANMRIVIGKLSTPVEEGSSTSGFQKQYEVSNMSMFSRVPLPARTSEQGNVIGSVRICNSYTMVERDYR